MSNIPENIEDDVNSSFGDTADDVRIAGDWADDDPGYIEDIFQQHNQPPAATELPTEKHDIPHVAIKTPNRLLCVTYETVGAMADPVMLLPADVNRKSVILIAGLGVGYYVGESMSALQFAAGANSSIRQGIFVPGTNGYSPAVVLEGYTGAVWVKNSPAIGAAVQGLISIAAITE